MAFVLETERLILREFIPSDLDALYDIMGDLETMQIAYERTFSIEEVKQWMERHYQCYETLGYGLFGVVLKDTSEVIGQCGLTWQPWKDKSVLEIGYLFSKKYWHHGYATEAAIACKEYAFSKLNEKSVYSIIRDTHKASINVAIRNGMIKLDEMTKEFHGVEMNFELYGVNKG